MKRIPFCLHETNNALKGLPRAAKGIPKPATNKAGFEAANANWFRRIENLRLGGRRHDLPSFFACLDFQITTPAAIDTNETTNPAVAEAATRIFMISVYFYCDFWPGMEIFCRKWTPGVPFPQKSSFATNWIWLVEASFAPRGLSTWNSLLVDLTIAWLITTQSFTASSALLNYTGVKAKCTLDVIATINLQDYSVLFPRHFYLSRYRLSESMHGSVSVIWTPTVPRAKKELDCPLNGTVCHEEIQDSSMHSSRCHGRLWA